MEFNKNTALTFQNMELDRMFNHIRHAANQGILPNNERVENANILIELADAINLISVYMADELDGGSHPNYAHEKLDKARRRIEWAVNVYKSKMNQ